MNPILQLLSSVEGHAKRQWLKIVAGFATLVTGWLAARLGFNDSITAPLTTAILAIGAYVFEMVSSKLANQQRLGGVGEPLQPVKEKLPGYSKVYESGKGTLTQEQQVNREACGIPSAEEVDKEVQRMERQRKPVAGYKVRIRQPQKKSRFIECKSLSEAKKLVKIEVDSGKHPTGTEIEIIPPMK